MRIFPHPFLSRCAAVSWAMFLVVLASMTSVTNVSAQTKANANATIVTLTGLRITDTTVGSGPSPKVGQTCVINYTTWLYVNGAKGDKVESSLDRGQSLTFVFGKGQVRREWDEGIATMKVGGKRTIIAPTEVGVSPAIDKERGSKPLGQPPGLIFEIELLDVR